MLFQFTRAAWVAMSPMMIRNTIRKTPAHANTANRLPVTLGLFVFDQLQDAQRISRAGQKRAKSDPRLCMSRILIVPSRNITPIMINTTGPAMERGGRGDCIGGGVMVGLATVHLTRWRDRWNRWYRRYWRNRPSRRICVRTSCVPTFCVRS